MKDSKGALFRLALVMVLAVGISITGALAFPSTAASVARGPRVLFFGDSLTMGAYATDQAHSYTNLVTRGLHAQMVETDG